MASFSISSTVKILRQLNDRGLPWPDFRFVLGEKEYVGLGEGGFANVCVMEDIHDATKQYAVKIIGFKDGGQISQNSQADAYWKEAVSQRGISEGCDSVVRVLGAEFLSVRLDENLDVAEARIDRSGIGKPEWIVLFLIRMEKLEPILNEGINVYNYRFTREALRRSDEKEILSLAINIAEALTASHKLGFIHRDVKLENILYHSDSGRYQLGDFGIARITSQASSLTKGCGTSLYCAPEVEDGEYDLRADIYSFGVAVYLALNDLKFPGSEGYFVNESLKYDPDAKIPLPVHGSQELKEYICTLIKYFPKDRPDTMGEVLRALLAIYEKQYGEFGQEIKVLSAAGTRKQGVKTGKNVEVEKARPEKPKTVEPKPEEAKPVASKAEEAKPVAPKTEEVKSVTPKTEEARSAVPKTDEPWPVEAKREEGKSAEPKPEKPGLVESKPEKPKSPEPNPEKPKPVVAKETREELLWEEASKSGTERTQPLFAGVIGFLLMVLGLGGLGVILQKPEVSFSDTMVVVSLAADSVLAIVGLWTRLRSGKRPPYFLFFLLFVFSLIATLRGGAGWILIVMTIALLIGGTVETAAVTVCSWLILFVLPASAVCEKLAVYCMDERVWIFLMMASCGFFVAEYYEMREDDWMSVIFGNGLVSVVFGILALIGGLCLWVFNKVSSVQIAELWMNLHFVYVGIALLVTGTVLVVKGNRT